VPDMSLAARLSLVTLGVADVPASERFYQALGWEVAGSDADDFRVFRLQGAHLALFADASLREDAGDPAPAGPGFRGVACAINLGSEAEVDAAFDTVRAAGGTVLKGPEKVSWGGYSGYFADPDGHAWELAYNPFWPLGEDGRPVIGG